MAQARSSGGFLNGVSADTKRYVRELKNKVYNYSEMEQMVREATCNDATEPKVTLMREVAKGTVGVIAMPSAFLISTRQEFSLGDPIRSAVIELQRGGVDLQTKGTPPSNDLVVGSFMVRAVSVIAPSEHVLVTVK